MQTTLNKTSLREAATMALEALELEDMACRYEKEPTPEHIAKAITALHAALAEPDGPCPTCVSLARTVMMDQAGQA